MSNIFKKPANIVILPIVVAIASVISTQAIATNQVSANQTMVTKIHFSGLNRVTPESLYPLLPVSVGSVLDSKKLSDSIEALYASEFFFNIDAQFDKGQLTFIVTERPIISNVSFTGNKMIPDEGLTSGLKRAGIAQGSVLKEATLQEVQTEIQKQYLAEGYYNSNVSVKQKVLSGNRVDVEFNFDEGKPAKVIDINIVGNKYFNDKQVKEALGLKEKSWKQVLSKSSNFAQKKLDASLKNVERLYFNAGFVRFNIEDSIVNIDKNKEKVFIELSLKEGDRYSFGDVNFLGEHEFTTVKLKDFVGFRATDQYSQEKLSETNRKLKQHFTNSGYYYAQIRPVRHINDKAKVVDVDFYIDPVRPIYVRRVNFSGNTETKDEVLRREMRQLEGALTSKKDIERSRVRLMRTGFFKDVGVQVVPVKGLSDQVDVNYTVKEQSTGSSTIAAGYSEKAGVTFQLEMNQDNFMGSGNRVNTAMSRSETSDSYSIGLRDPYFTEDGVSQNISGYYRKTKYDNKNVSNYITDSMGGTIKYGYPVDENIRVNAGVNIDKTELRGGRFMGVSNVDELIKDGGKVIKYTDEDEGNFGFEKDYTTYNLLVGWDYNSLDKPVFPTEGMNHSVNLKAGFGDKKYQKAVYKGNIYKPLTKDKKLIARAYSKLGYGEGMPFYENFYAGGAGSVRGYKYSSLGPQSKTFYDTQDNTQNYDLEQVGGNAVATVGTELILPMPFKGDWAKKVRPALFVEGGQVFDTTDRENKTFDSYPTVEQNVPLLEQDNKFRLSAGAGVTWYTPIGPISLSYSQPFNDQEGDQVEKVQFQIGNVF